MKVNESPLSLLAGQHSPAAIWAAGRPHRATTALQRERGLAQACGTPGGPWGEGLTLPALSFQSNELILSTACER